MMDLVLTVMNFYAILLAKPLVSEEHITSIFRVKEKAKQAAN
jgi:hypothetical protein